MKILHITGAKSWGGNEQQLLDSCIELNKLNITNYIYCYKNSPIENKSIENNIDIINSINFKTFSLKKGKQLSNIVKSKQIDIIHLHTSDSVTTYVASDILFNLKVPAVFSKKGINSSIKKGLSAYKYNYKNIKQIICVSNAVLESFKETLKPKNHNKLTVIYDGVNINRIIPESIDIRQKYKINKNDFIIGNIANHTKAKDLVTLVETANYLINTLKIKNVVFFQIGKKSNYSNEFLPLISKYDLQKYFIITDFLDNASGYIHKFDAYIMTSEREGGPTSLIEALFHKKPIISTSTGVTMEIFSMGGFIKLSNVKDYKSLAKNIVYVMNNKNLEKTFYNDSSKLFLDKFTVKQLSLDTLKIYRNIVT